MGSLINRQMGSSAVTSVVGLWQVDANTKLASIDVETARMLKLEGFSPGRPVDLDELTSMIQEDDRAAMREIHLDVARIGGPFLVEFRVVGKDGDVRWLQCRGQYALNEHSMMAGRGVVIDVTDLHSWSGPLPNRFTPPMTPPPDADQQADPLMDAAAQAVELRTTLGKSGHGALRLAADLLLWEINTALAARHTVSGKVVPGLPADIGKRQSKQSR